MRSDLDKLLNEFINVAKRNKLIDPDKDKRPVIFYHQNCDCEACTENHRIIDAGLALEPILQLKRLSDESMYKHYQNLLERGHIEAFHKQVARNKHQDLAKPLYHYEEFLQAKQNKATKPSRQSLSASRMSLPYQAIIDEGWP